MSVTAQAPTAAVQSTRIHVFVDFWNFQLTLNEREAAARGLPTHKFEIKWADLGPWLAAQAANTMKIASHSFEGMSIYASHDPRSDGKFFNWINNWLSKQPGVHVECRERKPKGSSKCSECHKAIDDCPHCKKRIRATQEKGVDTLLATDMIRLAWEEAYDVAVLATSDRDLIPAVEFLYAKGRKVIHAGFPPKGSDLSKACWGSFDVHHNSKEIQR